jgi:hypothetical protein
MSNLATSNLFGKTQVPPPSSNENTATYTVSSEISLGTNHDIVAYYTFPGLEDYVNMPSANRDVRDESYLPKDAKPE